MRRLSIKIFSLLEKTIFAFVHYYSQVTTKVQKPISMAASSLTSCSSDPTPKWKYHVFLSFRGEDTRYNFADHLYTSLCKKAIITFRDNEELESGVVIKYELVKAITESLVSIVILSQNYASSCWCLNELREILRCSKTLGRKILPIFYGVDPSDVRNQRGSFAEAFRRHEERFGEKSEEVRSWREALSEVANISGHHSKDRLVLQSCVIFISFFIPYFFNLKLIK